MGVYHGFEKNETATMFFLKKPSLVLIYTGMSSFIDKFCKNLMQLNSCDQ